jgi:hypothetical protein
MAQEREKDHAAHFLREAQRQLDERKPVDAKEAGELERARRQLEFLSQSLRIRMTFLAELAPAESLLADRERVKRLIEEPEQVEEALSRAIAGAGGKLEALYWAFGVPPTKQSGLYVRYELHMGGTTEDVSRAMEAGGQFSVVQTRLLRTSEDMRWDRWAQTEGRQGE